jgi:hypothetical protein
VTLGWRGSDADDALQVDVYLESLLEEHARRPHLASAVDEDLDLGERRVADLLAARLVRFHPSFRFEEMLAGRLRAAADRLSDPSDDQLAVGPLELPPVVPFPVPSIASDRRRVIIGGAIASGVSLAGAAIVAWRATSPPRSAFGRATRAAHRARPTMRGRA